MIKVGRFELTRDQYGWTMVENYAGKDRKGNLKNQIRKSYHATIRQCVQTLLDKDLGNKDLVGMLDYLDKAEDILVRKIENVWKDPTDSDNCNIN